jgi:hypothetical protein
MKRMKKTYLLCIILISFSCESILFDDDSTFSCQELREYSLDEKISFQSKNEILEFNINDVYTFSNEKGEYCGISVGYETSIENNYKIKERSGSGGSFLDSEDGYLEITFVENPETSDIFKIKQKNNGNYQNEILKVEYFNNYVHNGITYKYVIIGTKDTINSTPKISKVVRAIPGGILEFHDFETNQNWKLINN